MALTQKPLIVALDFRRYDEALRLAEKLSPKYCRVKIGKTLFTRDGPRVLRALGNLGFEVFLDLKFHDIPHTVAEAVSVAAEWGVWMVDVHASGGEAMLHAAREALKPFPRPPLLIGVTVLTSMDEAQLSGVGIDTSAQAQVERLAVLVRDAGLDGVVCSAREVQRLKAICGRDFLAVTPGIRPPDSALDDQNRVATPAQALQWGSDYLVVGRPITASDNPAQALQRLLASLAFPSP